MKTTMAGSSQPAVRGAVVSTEETSERRKNKKAEVHTQINTNTQVHWKCEQVILQSSSPVNGNKSHSPNLN